MSHSLSIKLLGKNTIDNMCMVSILDLDQDQDFLKQKFT